MPESYIRTLSNGRPQVRRAEALCSIRNNALARDNEQYSDIFDNLDDIIRNADSRISRGALNNIHGDWYEWFLAIEAWNYCIENEFADVPFLLPNIRGFDVAALYEEDLFEYIVDLREKVEASSTVQLITSNPDFVILDREVVDRVFPLTERITELTPSILSTLNSAHSNFRHECGFEDVVGYVSVKTSLRPDRRLQLSHEGSLMKALYVHLQTREWIINPPGLKYYGMSTTATDADRAGLKTVATHSITTVQSTPEPAVDELYAVNSPPQARAAFAEIL